MLFCICLLTIGIVLCPQDAFAWGPGTHLEVAQNLLKEVALFSPAIAALIKKYRDAFMYGMVSADVLVGKKYAGYLHHNHNWAVGWQVFERCKSDKEKASAYGYLTHLAADIIAHNYYIPYMIIKSYDTKMKHHAYWELRFDVHVPAGAWPEVRRVIKADVPEFDRLLERILKRPMFSYRMNKRIFNTILLMQQYKYVRKMVEIHSKYSQWPLSISEVRHYKYLITKTARDFLINPNEAECLKGDPAGHWKLRYASDTRKDVKRYVNSGKVSREEVDRFIKKVKGELKKTIFEPGAALPEVFEIK